MNSNLLISVTKLTRYRSLINKFSFICEGQSCRVRIPALGHGFFRQNTSGYAIGVLTPKASPSGWVFSQAQHPMIKTYIKSSYIGDDSIKWLDGSEKEKKIIFSIFIDKNNVL